MNVVCIGAHPDDCEIHAGGTCAKWARLGHRVLTVSLTNGDAGHHEQGGGPLAARRTEEAHRAAALGGFTARVLGYHDAELEVTLEVRKTVVRILREWGADLVITHRPYDYHPDHRYCSLAVQDAAFLVTVPGFCPETAHLDRNPVFLYMMDRFKKPAPFAADIGVDVDDAIETKLDMMDAMVSQVYEWLPWLSGDLEAVPADAEARRRWLVETWEPYLSGPATLERAGLAKWYGEERAATVRYAEFFELCEYGRQPSPAEIRELFPFAPDSGD